MRVKLPMVLVAPSAQVLLVNGVVYAFGDVVLLKTCLVMQRLVLQKNVRATLPMVLVMDCRWIGGFVCLTASTGTH